MEALCLSPSLKRGNSLPIFNELGNLHSLNDLLVIILRGSEITSIKPFTNLFDMPSNPEEDLGANPFIIILMSSVVTSLKVKVSFGGGAFFRNSSAVMSGLSIVLAKSGAKLM